MLFCFSSQKDDEYLFLGDDQLTESEEAHDNCINTGLLQAATANLRHSPTTGTTATELASLDSPVKLPTPRTFRKSNSTTGTATNHHNTSTANISSASSIACSKFVDPSDNNSNSATSSNHNSCSALLSKLGPGSFLRRNISQLRCTTKGLEHLQREALRKSNESNTGSVDNSQRYIRLPSSPSSKQQSLSLLSPTIVTTIARIGGKSHHTDTTAHSTSVADVLIDTASDSIVSTTTTVSSNHSRTSPPSFLSTKVPPAPTAPTLVPRSPNNPPPRPKTEKPSKMSRHPVHSTMSSEASSSSSQNGDHHQHHLHTELHTASCSTSTSSRQVSAAITSTPATTTSAASTSSTFSASSHHHQHQQFINKPPRGWLHPDNKLADLDGVTYAVRYIGCLGVNTSMKSLDFDTRSLIAKECINRVCEAARLKTVDKKRRTDKRILRMLADTPNMEHAGVDVNLSITSSYLNLVLAQNGENLAKHEMPNISFASGGDSDTFNFAAYVAKDPRFGRACFVLECDGGRAQDVITTIGQAFELRFKEFLKRTPRNIADRLENSHFNGSHSNQTNHLDSGNSNNTNQPTIEDREYYNDLPGKIPPDIISLNVKDAPVANGKSSSVPHATPRGKPVNGFSSTTQASADLCQVNLIDLNDDQSSSTPSSSGLPPTATKSIDPQYVNCMAEDKDPFDMQPFNIAVQQASTSEDCSKRLLGATPLSTTAVKHSTLEYVPNSDLHKEEWFHGLISRKESESLVIRDGDFLVRESQGSTGQYVLTGMQDGNRKHLLLVDPEGVVRTKDKTFESVSHLINYHRSNVLPIISSESALMLKNSIAKKHC